MRRLTFLGFLKQYCRELSGEATLSMTKLYHLAANDCPRVREPLFFLAVLLQKTGRLLQLSQNAKLGKEYRDLAANFKDADSLLDALKDNDSRLPYRYHKVYAAYLSKSHRVETDRNVSLLMRDRVLNAMRKKRLTNYRVYTELGLNPGNINAYLKNADATKVSRTTARKILEYVDGK
jgi:hypothetical protein